MPQVVLALLLAAAPASADVTDRFTRTVTISPGAPISVQITVGQLQILGWDRPDVSVEIVRRAPDTAQLERMPISIGVGAEGLSVIASQPDSGRDAALRSDVVLRVPAQAQLRSVSVFEGRLELTGVRGAATAHVERGPIVAKNVGGSLRLETAIGDIRLEGASLSPDGMMHLRTFNGDVALQLAGTPEHARILALSMGGSIVSTIPLTRQERWGARFAETTLGKGEPVISIDVVNGDIAITVEGGGR
jgi:hypothetical protein